MTQLLTRELSVVETRAAGSNISSLRVATSDPTYDIENMDVERYLTNPVVLWNHDHARIPIARTKTLTRNADGTWDADIEWNTEDDDARRIKKAFDRGFINGASISFVPRPDRPIELAEISIVNVPADAAALRKSLTAVFDDILAANNEEAPMTDTDIKSLVKKTIDEHTQQPTYDKAALTDALAQAVDVAIDEKLKAALDERDAARAEADKAEAAKDDAELALQERAENRAELLIRTNGMLPDEFVTKGKSERDIIVAALGDRVEDAASKSDDYLRARFDLEVENRSMGRAATMGAPTPASPSAGALDGELLNATSGAANILNHLDIREPHDGRPRQKTNA